MAQAVLKFADEAGKEAPPRRERLRLVIGFAVDFFRHLVRHLAGLPMDADAELAAAVRRAAAAGSLGCRVGGARRRSVRWKRWPQIDRNANLNTLVEAWLDDLLLLSRRQWLNA